MGNTNSSKTRRNQSVRKQANRVPGSSLSNNMVAASSPVSQRGVSQSAPDATLPPPPPYTPAVPPKQTRVSGSHHATVFASAGGNTSSNSTASTSMSRRTDGEDPLEILRRYNTILIVDDSSSMRGLLWEEASRALAALASNAGQYDTDGIDIYFLNSLQFGQNLKDPWDVQRLFNRVTPQGATPIGTKLEDLSRDYLHLIETANKSGGPTALKNIKPINYIVITDGAPTDDPESVIEQIARRLDQGNFPVTQIGIQFVQIGNSKEATEYLRELDDGLTGARDIVDTTPYRGQLNAETLIKILLGAINRRVDRRGASAVQ